LLPINQANEIDSVGPINQNNDGFGLLGKRKNPEGSKNQNTLSNMWPRSSSGKQVVKD
jgi:hypothetical protein